jgi:hypothetical protein
LRYIAAAEQEWLYPEKFVSTDHWKHFGGGYLLMPEPRLIYMGGQVVIGYKGGRSDAFSEYGHKPWQRGYKDDEREKRETESLYRFRAEYAVLRGPKFIARSHEFGGRGSFEDDDDDMERHRQILKKYRKR